MTIFEWAKNEIAKIEEYEVSKFNLENGFEIILSRPQGELFTIGLCQNEHFYECIEVNCENLEDVVNDLESLYYVKKGGNK